jgi:hypothetical protein
MCNFVFVSKLYSIGLLYLEMSKEVSYEVYCKLLPPAHVHTNVGAAFQYFTIVH